VLRLRAVANSLLLLPPFVLQLPSIVSEDHTRAGYPTSSNRFKTCTITLDNTSIVNSLHTLHVRRQMTLNPLPLRIGQPKQVLAHDRDSAKNESGAIDQDCLV